MTRYYVHVPASIQTVDVQDDVIVRSTFPLIGPGALWSPLRNYLDRHGFAIEPEIENQPRFISYKGTAYEFEWRGPHYARIVQHTDEGPKEIRFSELPDQVKKLL